MKVQEAVDTLDNIDAVRFAVMKGRNTDSAVGGYLTIDEETADKIVKIIGDYQSYILSLEVRKY